MKLARRGISLTEMLVVMTACTVAFSLSGQLLTRVMRIYGQAQDHADIERSALRLSSQFRRDVHQAIEAALPSSGGNADAFLDLTMSDDSRIEYSSVAGGIVRRQMEDGQLAARETFGFPEAFDVVVRRHDQPARLELTIIAQQPDPSPDQDAPAARATRNPINLHVEAVLGRDRPSAVAANVVEADE